MALVPWVPHIHRHVRHAGLLGAITGMRTLAIGSLIRGSITGMRTLAIGSLIRGSLIHRIVRGTMSPWIDLGEFIPIYPPMEDFDPAEMNTEQYWG